MRKIAASVLLKLIINGNEKCHSIDTPSACAELYKTLVESLDLHLNKYINTNIYIEIFKKKLIKTEWMSNFL